MEWLVEETEKLKGIIAKDEKLMRVLSEKIDNLLKEYGVKLKDNETFVFVPRVFRAVRKEMDEIQVKAIESMLELIERSGIEEKIVKIRCLPECGIPDPNHLRILESLRIKDEEIREGDIAKQIVSNKKLMMELSNAIFGALEERGIRFRGSTGCVFVPYVFEKPVFAQRIRLKGSTFSPEILTFAPEIIESKSMDRRIVLKPLPGIIVNPPWGEIPGVIIPPRIPLVGIPAPEFLLALDRLRESYF